MDEFRESSTLPGGAEVSDAVREGSEATPQQGEANATLEKLGLSKKGIAAIQGEAPTGVPPEVEQSTPQEGISATGKPSVVEGKFSGPGSGRKDDVALQPRPSEVMTPRGISAMQGEPEDVDKK